jgi:hypothetical protein
MALRKIIATFGIIGALAVAFPAVAATIEIHNPWAKQQSDPSKPGGIFLMIVNQGGADTLVSVSTPAAKIAQLHNNKISHGKMRMRRKTELDITAGAKVDLSSDGLHIMLMGLAKPLMPGTTIPVTLNFEKAGPVEVDVPVR